MKPSFFALMHIKASTWDLRLAAVVSRFLLQVACVAELLAAMSLLGLWSIAWLAAAALWWSFSSRALLNESILCVLSLQGIGCFSCVKDVLGMIKASICHELFRSLASVWRPLSFAPRFIVSRSQCKGFVNLIVTCSLWLIDSEFDAIVQFCSCPPLRWCASAKGRFLGYIVDLALMASSFLGEITSWEKCFLENHLILSESNAV